jgi:signal recognition particle subunit SRP54
MLETLSARIQKVLRDIRGEGRVSERHLDESLREIRMALLEADVNFKVVKEFAARLRMKALGQEVLTSLSPGQQVVKIVRDELIDLLGRDVVPLQFAKTPPTVILLVGLQGSGKTTTAGKLGVWLRKKGRRPLLVSTDVYRPAAIEQLSVVARAINMPVIGEAEAATALDRARRALTHARNVGYDVVIADTAGRLHIDDALMTELDQLKDLLKPTEILLVADAMTGQDAVNSAGEFDKRLSLTGVILTKFDGDARGGAALSIKSVTGRPIKFVGVGEKYDALEQFQPERVVGRILGMGDVLGLIEKAEEAVEQAEAARVLEKLRKDQFTLEDFRDQLRQLRRLGPLDQLVGMLPQIGPLKGLDKVRVDEKQLAHIEAIINSMTAKERENYRIIDGARRKRIALGSGRPVWEINRLIKQYQEVRKMMQQMGRGLLGKRFAKLNFLK